MARRGELGMVAIALMLLGRAATAQELPPLDMTPPGHADTTGKSTRHGKHGTPAASSTSASSQKVWSDLVHGSADQRAAEDEDNANAHRKPVDHSKDDFFSDWKGLK